MIHRVTLNMNEVGRIVAEWVAAECCTEGGQARVEVVFDGELGRSGETQGRLKSLVATVTISRAEPVAAMRR